MDKKKRNRYAGKIKGKSRASKYLKENPDVHEKKKKYDKDYHSSPERRKYRYELLKANRKAGTNGNGDKKDMSHTKKGKLIKEAQSKNRARNGKGGKPKKK